MHSRSKPRWERLLPCEEYNQMIDGACILKGKCILRWSHLDHVCLHQPSCNNATKHDDLIFFGRLSPPRIFKNEDDGYEVPKNNF
jgi:hypothetical protein